MIEAKKVGGANTPFRGLSRCLAGTAANTLAVTLFMSLIWSAAAARPSVISPKRLLEVADISGPVISPDGRMVAFRVEQASVEQNRQDTVWYVQDLDGTTPPRRIADGGMPLRGYSTGLSIPETPVWAPDGRAIYYRALIDGKIAVWRAASDGSGAVALTRDPADVRDFSFGANGRTLMYSVGATRDAVAEAEQAEYDNGVRIDDTVFIGAGLVRSNQLHGRAATMRFSGQWFEAGPLLAKTESRWREIDLVTLEKRDIDLPSLPARQSPFHDMPEDEKPTKWSRNPEDGRLVLLRRVGLGVERLSKPSVEISVVDGMKPWKIERCTDALCVNRNITSVQWRPGSDEVIFTVTDRSGGMAQALYRWDARENLVEAIVDSRGLFSGDSSQQRFVDAPCGVSNEVLVCATAEADRPPRLERIDIATGRRLVLFDPNASLASDMAEAISAELLHWRGDNDEEFSGWLFSASNSNAERPPLFVTYYSCEGFLRGGVGDEWPLTTLAGYGISALCINANPGYLDPAKFYDQALSGVRGAVEALASAGRIDPARVGMGGLSFGADVTMWTITRSELLSVASVASPSITPNWYLFNSLREEFREVAMKNWHLGKIEETSTQWLEMSPAFNLDKIGIPILFQLPEQEYLWSVEYAIPLIRSGRAEMYVFPNEPHVKIKPKHKLAAYERNVDWFRFWLQGYEDPTASKSDQYARWRMMKSY